MKRKYVTPEVEVVKVKIEKGFATSGVNTFAADGEAGMLEEGDVYEW